MTEVVSGDNWSYKMCKTPVKYCHHQQTNTQFLQSGCPSCRPTNSITALKQKRTQRETMEPWLLLNTDDDDDDDDALSSSLFESNHKIHRKYYKD